MNRSRCRVEVDTCGPRNRRLRCALSLPLLQQHVVVILSCVHWRALRWTLLLRRPLSIVIAIEGAVLCSLCVLMHVQWTHLNCRRTPSARMTTHGRLIEHDQCRRSWLCEHVTRRVVFLSWTDASSDVTYPRGRQSLLRQRSSSVSSVRAVATYVMFCNVPMYVPVLRVR